MKHTSKKLLESAIGTLHTILDRPNGPAIFTQQLGPDKNTVLDVVNAVLSPNTEGFVIVSANDSSGQPEGFFISRKPRELAGAAPDEANPDAEDA